MNPLNQTINFLINKNKKHESNNTGRKTETVRSEYTDFNGRAKILEEIGREGLQQRYGGSSLRDVLETSQKRKENFIGIDDSKNWEIVPPIESNN
jgi:hypothetical protein